MDRFIVLSFRNSLLRGGKGQRSHWGQNRHSAALLKTNCFRMRRNKRITADFLHFCQTLFNITLKYLLMQHKSHSTCLMELVTNAAPHRSIRKADRLRSSSSATCPLPGNVAWLWTVIGGLLVPEHLVLLMSFQLQSADDWLFLAEKGLVEKLD